MLERNNGSAGKYMLNTLKIVDTFPPKDVIFVDDIQKPTAPAHRTTGDGRVLQDPASGLKLVWWGGQTGVRNANVMSLVAGTKLLLQGGPHIILPAFTPLDR